MSFFLEGAVKIEILAVADKTAYRTTQVNKRRETFLPPSCYIVVLAKRISDYSTLRKVQNLRVSKQYRPCPQL